MLKDQNYNCRSCHPFTKAKCFLCVRSKLEALSNARALKKAAEDGCDRDKRDDLFSLISEDQLMSRNPF